MDESAESVLILASASQARVAMLRAVGLQFAVVPADINEEELHATEVADDDAIAPGSMAGMLARAKAVEVSLRFPNAVVIGGDQILTLDEDMLSKADSRDAARATLLKLRGRTHTLHSAAAIAIEGRAQWSVVDTAQLSMRDFSDAWLEQYLNRAGAALTTCVGAYEIEGLGLNLFEKVSGNHSTIMGLPVLPLLAELRARGILVS